MKQKIWAAPAFYAALLLSGCTSELSHMEPSTSSSAASSTVRSPEGLALSRAVVNRFPAGYGTVLVDETNNLTIVAGFDFEVLIEFCASGGAVNLPFDAGTHIDVRRPDGSLKVLNMGKNVNVVIFQGVFPGDYCLAYFSTPPLVIGKVNAVFHDNDFSWSKNRTDAFSEHLIGRGTYSETGKRVNISVKMQGLLSKDGSIRKLTTRIRLR